MEAIKETKFHVPLNYDRYTMPDKPWVLSVDVELPLVPVEPDKPDPRRIKKTVDRHHQITLSEWTSFIPHALAFNFSEFKQQPDWGDMMCSSAIRDHASTVSCVAFNVARFFNDSSLGSITTREEGTENRRQWLVIGEPELVGRNLDGEICGMIEVKMPWAVEINEKRLVALFNERRLHERTACAIAQTVGYMIDNHCKYGVLTTHNATRFLRAEDQDHIAISEVVLADAETVAGHPCSITLRRAFGYWLHLCTQSDGRLFYESVPPHVCCEPLLKKRHVVEEETQGCGVLCCTPHNSNAVLQSSMGPPAETTESKCHAHRGQWSRALVVIHRLFVPWSELQITDLLGTGRSGCVALARRGSLEFALKLFDVGKSVEGFEQELRAYTMLQSTNAKAAKLLLVTHSPSEQVFGLGLQLGRPLPPLESWSRKHHRGAMAALRSLLAVGIMQNDVRENNFIEDNDGKVLAIDFEDIVVVDATTNDDKNSAGCTDNPKAYLKRAWEELTTL